MDAFLALAEPTRRTIVELLAERGALPAMEIGKEFDASPPAISQHLKVLREARVVKVTKRGRERIYAINPGAVDEVEEWIKRMKWMWNERFDRLDEVLRKEKEKNKKYE